SIPTAKQVAASGTPGTEFAGNDFAVCDAKPSDSAVDACVPVFDYTMPDRFSQSKLANEYASPKSFEAEFTIQPGAGDNSVDYSWTVDGDAAKIAKRDGPCVAVLEFPKVGSYKVHVEGNGTEYAKKVVIQDLVIASLGDSLASGEGNPPYLDHAGA